jgi:UDP-N-acetylmuramyl pentapeptide phosphotransferase/UDP-N-acetylglucosamine-1-phosphate transferase
MIAVTAAAAATALATGLGEWINWRWRGWLPDDPPGPGRKQHGRPIPLAGIVLLLLLLPWLALLSAYWLAAAVAIAGGIGYLDDRGKEHRQDLDWRWKALALWLASGIVVAEHHTMMATPWEMAFWLVVTFVLVNATNFLDNTDGVATSLSAVSLLWLTGATGPAAPIAGAALGFLPWNWPRARVFLGDAGAYTLGIAVAWALLARWPAGPNCLAGVAIQLVDFCQVVTARLVIGVAPWIGDRRHLTHIAQNWGVRRALVAPLFAALATAAVLATLLAP